jgi:hypothetical protein
MKDELGNITQAEGVENGPEWNPTPEENRASDLSVLVYALRKMPDKTSDIITNRTVMSGLAYGAREFRDELIAWAEAELAKLKI